MTIDPLNIYEHTSEQPHSNTPRPGSIQGRKVTQALISQAQNDGENVSIYIASYGITDQKALAEIALAAINQNPLGASKHITKYGITDPESLLKILKLTARLTSTNIYTSIENFAITDQTLLNGIAKIMAEEDINSFLCSIEFFGKIDKDTFTNIILKADANNESDDYWCLVSSALDELKIKEPKNLVEIAFIAAKKKYSYFSANIDKFGIQKESDLLDLAFIAAEHDSTLSANINKFHIDPKNQKALIRIASIAAKQYGRDLSGNIDKFGIQEESDRFAIAQESINNGQLRAPWLISKYAITDPVSLFKIAELLTERTRDSIYYQIQHFGITNQRLLNEIAKLVATKDLYGFLQNIEVFGEIDKDTFTDIILKAAANGKIFKYTWTSVYESLAKLKIKEPKNLVEIASVAAKQYNYGFSENIDKFGIQEESDLLDLAFIAAEHDSTLSANIDKYKITDQNELVRIALIAVKHNRTLSENIDKFGIEEESDRISLALIAVEHDHTLSENIDKYNITDQNELVRIAVAVHKKNPNLVAQYIDRAGISLDQVIVAVIAQYGIYNLSPLENYNLTEPETRIEVFLAGFKNLDFGPKRLDNICELKEFCGLSEEEYRSICSIDNITPEDLKDCLEQIQTEIDKPKNAFNKETMQAWLDYTSLSIYLLQKDREKPIILSDNFFSQVAKYRDPQMRYILIDLMLKEICKEETLLEKYNEKAPNQRSEGIKKAPNHLYLPAMLLTLLEKQGVKGCDEFLKIVINNSKNDFRNSSRMKYLINMLYDLLEESKLDSEDKTNLLKIFKSIETPINITQKERFTKNLDAISAILHSGGAERLKKDVLKGDNIDLGKMLSDMFKEAFEIGDIEEFNQNPSKALLVFRNLPACMTYKSVISKLKQPDHDNMLAELNIFVRTVLSSTFSDVRYDTTNNAHLRQVFEGREELKTKWQAGAKTPINGYEVVDSDDSQDLFLCGTEVSGSCQSVTGASELNRCLLGYVMNGQNRVIAVKGADEKIKARAIFRLLWDDKNQKPVLFIEKLYTAGVVDKNMKKAIMNMAKQRAESLGLTLLCKAGSFKEDILRPNGEMGEYPETISSLGGRAPHEYCDSEENSFLKGVFSISNAVIIYTPSESSLPS